MGHLKAPHGDVVQPGPLREEAGLSDVDLHQLPVGVRALEIGVDGGRVFVRLAEPLVHRLIRFQDTLLSAVPGLVGTGKPFGRVQDILQGYRFIEGLPIQVYLSGMHRVMRGRNEPVSAQGGAVGVEAAEKVLLQRYLPDRTLDKRPAGDPL